jgi:hypothetical protein
VRTCSGTLSWTPVFLPAPVSPVIVPGFRRHLQERAWGWGVVLFWALSPQKQPNIRYYACSHRSRAGETSSKRGVLIVSWKAIDETSAQTPQLIIQKRCRMAKVSFKHKIPPFLTPSFAAPSGQGEPETQGRWEMASGEKMARKQNAALSATEGNRRWAGWEVRPLKPASGKPSSPGRGNGQGDLRMPSEPYRLRFQAQERQECSALGCPVSRNQWPPAQSTAWPLSSTGLKEDTCE